MKRINAADIIIDERVRLKCQVPLCDSYNRNLMCPPHTPSVAVFEETLSRYSRAILLQVCASAGGSNDPFRPAKRLHELVNIAEKEAFLSGFRFAAGFIGGCCRLCRQCVAVRGGITCRFERRETDMALLKEASIPIGRMLFIPRGDNNLKKDDLLIESNGQFQLIERPDCFVIKNAECCRSILVKVNSKE